MASNYPQQTASRDVASVDGHGDGEGLGLRMMDRVRQALCGLHGHDSLLQFERDRMFLKCASCGHETPGWEIKDAAPTVTPVRVDASRALPHPQLIRARRIA